MSKYHAFKQYKHKDQTPRILNFGIVWNQIFSLTHRPLQFFKEANRQIGNVAPYARLGLREDTNSYHECSPKS